MGRYQIDFKQKQADAKYKSGQQTQLTKAEKIAAIKAKLTQQKSKYSLFRITCFLNEFN